VLTSPYEIYITGRAAGVTNMTLWLDKGKYRIYDVEVGYDVSRSSSRFKKSFRGERPSRNDHS